MGRRGKRIVLTVHDAQVPFGFTVMFYSKKTQAKTCVFACAYGKTHRIAVFSLIKASRLLSGSRKKAIHTSRSPRSATL